jgi:ribose-phosphate pyrophosphokinase
MNEFVTFDVKQFASGEYQVKIINRIYNNAIILYNWFDEKERDLMLLLTKIGAVRKTYGMIDIIVYAPYLPYARQDRVFEVGQDIAIETFVNAVKMDNKITIETMGLHCNNIYSITNDKIKITDFGLNNFEIVFSDLNAKNHFILKEINKYITFEKIRTNKSIELTMIPFLGEPKKKYIICDDVIAGGRTFIECAKKLKEKFGNDIIIEIFVYNAFLDYGLNNLIQSGISKIHIVNKYSYNFLIEKYSNDCQYFNHEVNFIL